MTESRETRLPYTRFILTNLMKNISSLRANTYSADEENPSSSGIQKLIRCVHKCLFFRVGSTISIPKLRKNITNSFILRVNELVPVDVDQHPLATL